MLPASKAAGASYYYIGIPGLVKEAPAPVKGGPPRRPKASLMSSGRPAAALAARAKINLRLDVLDRQPGGLHAIRSMVADLEIADDVEIFHRSGAFAVTCEGADIPERENLAWLAAQRLGVDLSGLHVNIRKRIPIQAGLGGGSADAAAVLRALISIFTARRMPLSKDKVHAATRVGSDVPACMVPGFKIVEGTGEIVRPIPVPAPPWGIILLRPAVGVPTSEAYRLLDAAREQGAQTGTETELIALRSAIGARNFERALTLLNNDFQQVVELVFPQVASVRERLRAVGATATLLCGSGSCVAGFFEDRHAADIAFRKISRADGEWTVSTGFARA